MALTKAERKQVWDKSNGLCWYCGFALPEKGWHADHLEPIRRYANMRITDDRVEHFMDCEKPHLDTIDNTVPACAPCNLFKSVFTVDEFREQIERQVAQARKSSVNFRTAERFGQLAINEKPIVFWFEQVAI